MKHSSIVGGSTSSRVINCPASVKLSEGVIRPPASKHADRGTLLHDAISKHIAGSSKSSLVNFLNYKGITLTQDLWDEKIAVALALLDEIDPDKKLDFIEEVEVSFGDFLPDVFGSVDLIGRLGDRVIVLDWKFGDGVVVDAEENNQLLFYAAAARRTEKLSWVFEGAKDIELIIVQPPVCRRWVTTLDRVSRFESDLYAAVSNALHSETPTIKSGAHCRWCPAKMKCPAMAELTSVTPKAAELSVNLNDIAASLDKMAIVEEWITSVKQTAHKILEDGGTIPGYKLVTKRALRTWVDPDKAKEALLNMGIDKEDIIESSLLSPAKVEKILKVKKLSLPAEHVIAISSGNTLVSTSDPRPSISDMSADFANAIKHLK